MIDDIFLGDNLDFDADRTISFVGAMPSSDVTIKANTLIKHATILGGTGSGKTVLAKVMLEELALAGVPSIVIDVQGDLAKLAEGPSGDSRVDSDKAARWSESTEPRIWTPVSDGGLALSLNPFSLPDAESGSKMTDSIDRMARGLTSILGYNVSKPAGKKIQAHLIEHITELRETDEHPLNFSELALSLKYLSQSEFLSKNELIELIRRVESSTVGSQSLLYSMGASLNMPMFMTPSASGKTPINIIYLNTLQSEELKQIFIQQLVRNLYEWMIQNPPSDEIRLALFLDEAAPYLPPDPRMPPAKEGLRVLLKQARKYGIGCILATQSPGDFDYRSAGQASTVAIGRFTQPQDIKKVDQIIHSPGGHDFSKTLPSIGEGRFLLFSPDNYPDLVQMQTRWLITPHGTPLSIDKVASLTTKKLRTWASKYGTGKAQRKGEPFWMKERDQPVKGDEGAQPTTLPQDIGEQDSLVPTYSHYRLEKDGFSRLLILNSIVMLVALASSSSNIMHAGTAVSTALSGVGAILALTSLMLLASNFNDGRSAVMTWVEHHSTKIEILIFAHLTALLVANDAGQIQLGWTRWSVISAQTIVVTMLILDQIIHAVFDRMIVSGQSLGHRVRALRDFVTSEERSQARRLSEGIFTRFGLFTNLLTIAFLALTLTRVIAFDTEFFYLLAYRILSLEAIHFVTISSLLIRGD